MKTKVRPGTVSRKSWLDFLQTITRWEDDARLINGHLIASSSDTRALYRWESEGAVPLWWKADVFLCRYFLTWHDFELWCWIEGRDLWETEAPPGFEES